MKEKAMKIFNTAAREAVKPDINVVVNQVTKLNNRTKCMTGFGIAATAVLFGTWAGVRSHAGVIKTLDNNMDDVLEAMDGMQDALDEKLDGDDLTTVYCRLTDLEEKMAELEKSEMASKDQEIIKYENTGKNAKPENLEV